MIFQKRENYPNSLFNKSQRSAPLVATVGTVNQRWWPCIVFMKICSCIIVSLLCVTLFNQIKLCRKLHSVCRCSYSTGRWKKYYTWPLQTFCMPSEMFYRAKRCRIWVLPSVKAGFGYFYTQVWSSASCDLQCFLHDSGSVCVCGWFWFHICSRLFTPLQRKRWMVVRAECEMWSNAFHIWSVPTL